MLFFFGDPAGTRTQNKALGELTLPEGLEQTL